LTLLNINFKGRNGMKLKRLSIAFVTALLVVLFSIPFMPFPSKIYADSVTYVIGDTGPAGGIIFYDKGNDNNGWRYLESAPSDQSAGAAWSNITTLIGPTAQGTAIGTGQTNTTAIINHGATSGAAWLCDNLVESGYSDWFLPSINELAALRTALASTAGDRTKYGFNQTYYWSSSEYSAYYAGLQNFLTGSQHSSTGSSLYGVRAVRAFSVSTVSTVPTIPAVPVWVRTMFMTCYRAWINEDNKFQFIFWYPYRDNNWVKIYDMEGKMVYEIDMPYDNPNLIVDLPDGMYTVKTFTVGSTEPRQTFVIGK
jgi:hypothetical protein